MMPDTSLPNGVAQFHLRDRLMRLDWSRRRPVMVDGDWSIYVDPQDMPTWNAWVRRGQQLVVVSNETWLILSGHGPALTRLLHDVMSWPKDGLIYLPIDGVYREAALAYSKVTGQDVARGKDAITALEERVTRLLNYASDLSEMPRDGKQEYTLRTVVSEMVEIEDDLKEVAARLERVQTMVGLAKIHAETAVAR